jgi:hypothetical protein
VVSKVVWTWNKAVLRSDTIVFSVHPKPLGMTQSSQNGTTVYQNAPEESFDLEDSGSESDSNLGVRVMYEAGLLSLVSKVVSNELQCRDLVVMMVYLSHSDWRTGRCRLTIHKVAKILSRHVKTLYPAIRRLKLQNLLVPVEDPRTGEVFHIISPFLLKAGSNKARGYLLKTYYDAINNNQPETSDPDGDELEVTG